MLTHGTDINEADSFTAAGKAYAIAELRTWFQLDTWTVREGLLLLVGIDPYRADDFVFTESGFTSVSNPWALITALPGLSFDGVDTGGWPRITGYVFDPTQVVKLSRLLNMWVSKPGHTLNDRHSASYYLEWAIGKNCPPFWHPWVIDAGLFSDRQAECLPSTADPSVLQGSDADQLTRLQDDRLAWLRESGGKVGYKKGLFRVAGIAMLVRNEEATGALLRSEKTIREQLKAAYDRENEFKRIGRLFDQLGSP